MAETQSFRATDPTARIENIDVDNIDVDNIDGQNVVFWEDIEHVFPGVQYVRNGSSAVKFLRDSNRDRIMPLCIKHQPDVVLDVVFSSTVNRAHVDPPLASSCLVPADASAANPLVDHPVDPTSSFLADETMAIIESAVAETLQVPLAPAPITLQSASKVALSFKQVVQLASNQAQVFNGQTHFRNLDAKMDHMIKLQVAFDAKQEELNQLQSHSFAQQQEMKQLQKEAFDRQEKMLQLSLDHQAEIKQLQIEALGQLAVIQDRVKAVLTQTYELHEYPIPRLFVILPEDPSKWDTVNPFWNKFRLYFLCECGEHSALRSSQSKVPHHIHIAMHEGYEINRPTEFFRQYGAYALLILRMLKFGITVAGLAIPALPFLISADSMGQIATSVKHWQENIEVGVDRSIDHIDNALALDGGAVEQMASKEALEGADLRKLDTFLRTQDGDNVLGNLYRIVTDEGHVKWVCIDHYRENYQESTAMDFQRTLGLVGGSFDRNIGEVCL
ncbi:hypothetical protein BGZ70_002923 [Mortierella alpina]|uniref:Uncharacterized protein n=1 Tax=Mortierella alpina TaxID=64518 RepID=A0A9P6M5B2_MORAP|nr:hypothetical protein BGZ70_002923 [Mortierella alpina]